MDRLTFKLKPSKRIRLFSTALLGYPFLIGSLPCLTPRLANFYNSLKSGIHTAGILISKYIFPAHPTTIRQIAEH